MAPKLPSSIKSALNFIEVKHKPEEGYDPTHFKWGNRDIFPVPPEQRRFGPIVFISFWVIASMSTSAWAFGGSIRAFGLNVVEGICYLLVSGTFIGLFAFLCGHAGSTHHLGFTAMCRTSFGLYGAYLPVLLLVFENIIFFGMNAYFGGQAVAVTIAAMSSSFMYMENTLPDSAGITTQNLVGFVVFCVVFMLLIPIHSSKFHNLAWTAALATAVVFFGMFGWAISTNGGKVGDMLTPAVKLSSVDHSFMIVYIIGVAAGSATAYSSRMPDWSRFSRGKWTPAIPSLLGFLIFGSISVILGIMATNAVYHATGDIVWNPLSLLQYIQAKNYTAGGRAATFFAGLAMFWSLIINNLMGKIVPAGMDCAGLFPRWITTRRGSVILSIIGILINPWRFVTQASTFVSVLSAFGVFVSPLTGILAADYWIVRRQKWKVPDIFKEEGIYWYNYGINWKAVVAFFFSIIWSMPGFAANIQKSNIATGWKRMYQMSYILNLAFAVFVYVGLSYIFRPKGLGESEEWSQDDAVDNGVLPESLMIDEKDSHLPVQLERTEMQMEV